MTERLRWGARTYLMGIINVTPDSFSGDGLLAGGASRDDAVAAALELGRRFVADGADILDVGAESTRPPAVYGEHAPVDAQTEAAAAVPVVAALARELDPDLAAQDATLGQIQVEFCDMAAAACKAAWA